MPWTEETLKAGGAAPFLFADMDKGGFLQVHRSKVEKRLTIEVHTKTRDARIERTFIVDADIQGAVRKFPTLAEAAAYLNETEKST